MITAFSTQATQRAEIFRPVTQDDKKRGEAVKLTVPPFIMITPIATLDPETRLKMGLNGPSILWQTFAEHNPDLRVGDELVPVDGLVDFIGKRLVVRYVAKWPWPYPLPDGDIRVHAALEMAVR